MNSLYLLLLTWNDPQQPRPQALAGEGAVAE